MTDLEEEVLIQYIIDMDERGFVSKLSGVEDMVNYILELRRAKKVEKFWAYRFVKRYTKLKMRFSCVYDFQRALYEDPKLIEDFMMGIICPGMVVISAEQNGRNKAIQSGNREWATAIIYGNKESKTIPPFLVVQEQVYLSNWYIETDFPVDWAIKPTSNG
ncbi:hypothetical protein SS1G_03776 [Sclerotinia sclerotiorum 1980 UF-70]|uniref:HTH CENPB-type domain-containing protein n=1 Tax=Sclerotinia sclerotiorum (strain ATCC 18683 / 1980 / Ss-1) TaxID=665079 RepID=A7EEN6_SCLS1|nr:hypothetical protein SS1G_03776 [Sclerotinia sclerotiorum 1980 UF-70]EDO01302.1 hypothetical protein SS1G_03776 [Sclerotinia sclerotiorum 1980 UF-70]